ncbi:carboxypeptidase-like regulatory domain-containing protein [Mariniflexile sp. AS56]|uniref:carboxypeptidase-like regulatory domain-containing protein n=1 Tax=Mariniflexile sp. AS56 TaxID=3063957 RepID=UPI0026EB3B41|nr:carboxypeptidase-like regulatory domain-containing protein [Mariniflexile sp. AS56]MDO7173516.1 carboxypeptidase-like regulatory domain-containing protein [Mariniflexile sp. AS56]
MKQLIYTALLLFTALSFGQNTGFIIGKVLDNEVNNAPLVLANVSIKGTATTLNTDLTGLFIFENLKAGDYTLVCSFAGYETKEINVHVTDLEATEIKVSLSASTISLDELAMLTSMANVDEK